MGSVGSTVVKYAFLLYDNMYIPLFYNTFKQEYVVYFEIMIAISRVFPLLIDVKVLKFNSTEAYLSSL
jgi:hypothetical protein